MIAPTTGSTSATGITRAETVDVLVVDDDGPTRAVIIDALEYAGYTSRGAADGAAALSLAERLRPRVILLDLWMPVMDGWQFAAHYRNADAPLAPIVLLSADPQLLEATEQLGVYGFIQKPFDLDFFREVVARAIASTRYLRPAATAESSGEGRRQPIDLPRGARRESRPLAAPVPTAGSR